MLHSIRWRIAAPYVILILITMLGLGIYLSNFTRQTYLNSMERQLTAQARLIGDSLINQPDIWEDPERMDAVAKHYSRLMDTRITLISPNGTVLGESHEDRSLMDNHLNRPEIQQALMEGEGSSARLSSTVSYEMLYTAIPLTDNSSLRGFVRVALPLEQIQIDVSHLQQALSSITLVVTFLAVLLAAVIAGRTTRPLSELTDAAGQIASGALQRRLIPTAPDEIGRLTQAFNVMAVELQAQIEALETERSKMAAVLQEMTDGVVIVDNHGRVQLINPAAEQLFHVTRKDALGRSLAEVLRHYQLVELWQHCRETGEAQSVTLEIGAKRLYLQGVAIPLGQYLPGNTLFVFQNLTRVRQLETVRRDFISNISHELRTPLASLKALTETLQEGALDDPPMARRFLQKIETEVDALSHMVSELLELSRIESGRVPLQMKPILPKDLLSSAYERLRVQSERAKVQVNLDCPEDLPAILADHTRLEQVIVNLLHNAIKFTPAGGEIELAAEQKNESILFSVKDTGVGIPEADLPRIFERFYKADRARASGGTGLGLAIARHMVEAHDGKIWAKSEESVGSTFYFSIPLAH